MKPPPLRSGVYGGLAGGLVFAIVMVVNGTLTKMGLMTLPLIGRLVGQETAIVGFVVHMGNSVVLGVLYVLLFGRVEKGMMDGLHLGMLYGAVWWFIGPLTLLPMLLGMPIGSQWNGSAMLGMFPSFIGHIVYGAILGMTVGAARDRSLPDEAQLAEIRAEDAARRERKHERAGGPAKGSKARDPDPPRPLFFRHRDPPGAAKPGEGSGPDGGSARP